MTRSIHIRGVRHNNLKNLDLDIPLGQLTVVTGVSGSGKSSLAFDTIYAEGQRRYVETFSPYARQFLDRMDKPAVDRIDGIPPAIAIDQTNPVRTSRSTVGTMTEMNDHLKLLFARAAQLYCHGCGRQVRRDHPDGIYKRLLGKLDQQRVHLTFAVTVPRNFAEEDIRAELERQGYTRIQGREGDKLVVIQDRLRIDGDNRDRIIEALETALHKGRGHMAVYPLDEQREPMAPLRFSSELHCPDCNIDYSDPIPNTFSFNSPMGACPSCRGFGRVMGIDYRLAIPDENKTLGEGAVKPWSGKTYGESQRDMERFAKRDGIPLDVPWKDLSDEYKAWLIEGEPGYKRRGWYGLSRFFDYLESKAYKMHVRVMLSKYRSYDLCPECHGARLKPEGLAWRVGSHEDGDAVMAREDRHRPHGSRMSREAFFGLPGLSIHDVMQLSIDKVRAFFDQVHLPQPMDEASELLLDGIRGRLAYLSEVGLGYLTLDRQSRTLSGGEVQRINLTTALGTSLVNTLFVLDEPSIGLHPRDMNRIIAVMHRLRDAGNALLVVEHDPQVMLAADRILDIGPGPGERGGEIIFQGAPGELLEAKHSQTADYLTGKKRIALNRDPLPPGEQWLTIRGARENNLQDLDAQIPLQRLVCLTGVSGSGKSTLMGDVLYNALAHLKGHPGELAGEHDAIEGHEHIHDVVLVDQSAIGKTTRSNPASYVGAFDGIRKAFAEQPLAIERKYTPGTFSFNAGKGRCPTCGGNGFEHVEMQFLSDVYLRCPDCDGRRYRPEVLDVKIPPAPGCDMPPQSVADVLDMTVNEACQYFADIPSALTALEPLRAVGLGYMTLGQPVPTLSGGESQRLKLAGHLAKASGKRAQKPMLFLLDEPTTGLHFADVAVLLEAFQRLLDAGHSLVVIEHNLDIVNAADWVIDLGPEGGDKGGRIVATGSPDAIIEHGGSHTGVALKAYRAALNPAALAALESGRRAATGLDGPLSPALSHEGRGGKREASTNSSGTSSLPSSLGGTSSLPSPLVGEGPGERGKNTPSPETDSSKVREQTANYGNAITIRHAREHNLKNINLSIPREKLTVITGLSGSGKSTVAFDILFNEGQRRYLESLNAYARQFVQPAARPDVDAIFGIPPTVAIEQRTSRGGRKSTVATMTELHHFLRLLFVKLGTQHCPDCQVPIEAQSLDAITAHLIDDHPGQTVQLRAPLIVARKGYYTDLAKWAANKGFDQLIVDGEATPTSDWPRLDRFKEHDIDLPVAALKIDAKDEAELRRQLRIALDYGKGSVRVQSNGGLALFSTERACPSCQRSFPELDPRLFSYNSKHGWCPKCFGTGERISGFDAEQTGEESVWRDEESRGPCPSCEGKRLNPTALAVRFRDRSIADYTAESVQQAGHTFEDLNLEGREAAIARDLLPELRNRLSFLQEVGLGYLTLDRAAPTLSGGEAQRIRLAAQLGSNLQGVCYVLDEPTIGLHPRDNLMLLDTLARLEGKGNTIVVVEHDEDTIRRAEHVIDLGPGAGVRGGQVVAEGTVDQLRDNPDSVTGRYLAHPLKHPMRGERRDRKDAETLKINGAHLHNLKHVDLDLPLGRLVCVTGVSGSGKSSLVRGVLHDNLRAAVNAKGKPVSWTGCKGLQGFEAVDRVLEVDQTPIGKTPRSCPATYVGIWDDIRKLFAQTPEAKMRGFGPGRFSFNTADGRCPECDGQGMKKIEMNFLPDVTVPCELCKGQRFTPETLAATWKGRSAGEVLQMSIDEAVDFFQAHTKVHHALKLMQDVGLGYLTLGQPSPTLSGGEAQRIKLVTELAKARPSLNRKPPHTVYVLDEPTVGLHMADVEKLALVLHRLVDAGNSVVVIEHNLDLIAEVDWVVDIGPEGGDGGGEIVSQGAPEAIAEAKSHTGKVLRDFLS